MPKSKTLPINDSSTDDHHDHANERRDASRPPMLFTREFSTSWENMIVRYNLRKGRGGFWTGLCPDCRYPKPTLWAKPIDTRVVVGCFACNGATSISWTTINGDEKLVNLFPADNTLRAHSLRARCALLSDAD